MRKSILHFIFVILVIALMSASSQAVLVHKWNFNKTPGNPTGLVDVVGGIAATPIGGTISVGGGVMSTRAHGDYLDIDGPAIDINDYSAVTLVLWSINYFDQGYSMTASFGELAQPSYQYLAISTTRGDQVTRAMMTDGSTNPGYTTEVGENGPELNDGLMHQYVLTVGPMECCFDQDVITLYIDGVLQGAHIIEGRSLSQLSSSFAALAKSTYTADPTWIGDIEEFDIYDEALPCDVIRLLYEVGPYPVPEPVTIVLLGLGSIAILRRNKSYH